MSDIYGYENDPKSKPEMDYYSTVVLLEQAKMAIEEALELIRKSSTDRRVAKTSTGSRRARSYSGY